jgi:putative DNA-invertase from lambdoid prophage Rac
VLVVRWVDRLGRNYADVVDTIREFMRRGVVIRTVINNMTFDGATTDPMQCAVRDALIASMAATAHAQAEATKAAQRAGIEHAKASDDRVYLGRKPSYTRKQLAQVQAMLGQYGIAAIAKEAGLSRQTVYRIQDDPAGAEVALAVWEGLKETNPRALGLCWRRARPISATPRGRRCYRGGVTGV